MSHGVGEESKNRKAKNKEGTAQEPPVLECLAGIHCHDLCLELRLRLEAVLVDKLHDEDHDDHIDDSNRCKVLDERHEGELLHRAADHDVRRITDERCRAADIRCQDLREQEGHRLQMQLLRDAEGHRHHEEHRRHIIKECREDCRDDGKISQKLLRLRVCLLGRPNGNKIKQSRMACDSHENHHANQQAQRIEIHMMQRCVNRQNTGQHHDDRAQHRHNRTVNLLRHDHSIHQDKNCSRQNFHNIAS